MVHYRRNKQNGGTYFFTLNLYNRKTSLLTQHIHLLKDAMREIKEKLPYKIDALVVLPEHLYAIWTLPVDDANYSLRWGKIKANFTLKLIQKNISIPRDNKNQPLIWQHRFWEHTIRDDYDFEKHVNYIHYNPVKHNLEKFVKDWPYSTFHEFVRQGKLSIEWGCPDNILVGNVGE